MTARAVHSPDGLSIAVDDRGGSGPPTLLVHATGFCGAVLGPLADELGPGFHTITFDQRGHGDSGRPPDGVFDWRGFGADVLAVVDALGLERPLGFGHSSGGAALLLAEEARPGTFAALYCFEPVVPTGPPEAPVADNPMSAGALRRRPVFASRDEALLNFASKPPFDRLRPDVLEAYVRHGFADAEDGGITLKCAPADEAAVYANGFSHDAYPRLGLVRCPVTLACGARTDSFDEAWQRRLAAPMSSAQVAVLPGLGHFGPLEDPAAVAASVRAAFSSP